MVVILDFGSQYTQLIARRIREAGVYCEIHPYNLAPEKLRALAPQAVILSGGPASVYDEDAPRPDPSVFDVDVPLLGICYGQGLLVLHHGGAVVKSAQHEYGRATLAVDDPGDLLAGLPPSGLSTVWMSHGDRMERLPRHWHVLGSSDNSPYAAVRNRDGTRFGVQFHPEVVHSEDGRQILENFLFNVARIAPDWTMENFVEAACRRIREQVGDGHVICGVSGGVDSTVTAALIEKAVPGQLTCVFVNNGVLRKNEADQVRAALQDYFASDFVYVDASTEFLTELDGVIDPETKRKIIGRVFIEVFEKAAHQDERKRGKRAAFLAQGTLYPDVIESVSVRGPSATIKSHHNVGGLPERMNLELVEPLRELFKDEVRSAGKVLGLPADYLGRHPFPGPGLAIRILGAVNQDDLRILRDADEIYIEEIRKAGLYDEIWQAFAVLLPVRTVGVQGDDRTYDRVIALRAVVSQDGMTADWYHYPHEVLARMSSRISNEVAGVNRVTYDISSKPPATVEWE